ncbi:MAG: hypothetical protein JWQ96_2808 [Segetibacter sp.]|nr:hypothetical protein [Segetibacter sp.]
MIATSIAPTGTKEATFLGLESYKESQADQFFGREEEIKDLVQHIQYNTLTFLFGKSGTGKTSLLNAGVFPELREEDYIPFRIRLIYNSESPSLISQVWEVLKAEITRLNYKVEALIPGDTLWEFFHRESLWKIITPVLVFDQFEEIFTLTEKYPKRKEEVEELLIELADLVENQVPKKVKARYLNSNAQIDYEYKKQRVKVLISFREDFLAEMESITARIPSAKSVRYRLKPLNGYKALEVITKTWKSAIGKSEAEQIVTYTVNGNSGDNNSHRKLVSQFDVLEVEPALLSQVCSKLEKERGEEKLDKISGEFLKKYPKENILSTIYTEALKKSSGSVTDTKKPVIDKAYLLEQKAKKFIEDNLVNAKGFREKFTYTDINPGILPVIDGMQSLIFIRRDGQYIELAHDVIAAVVKKQREKRLKAEAEKAFMVKAIIIATIILFVSMAVFAVSSVMSKKKLDDAEVMKKNANTLEKKAIVDAKIAAQNKELYAEKIDSINKLGLIPNPSGNNIVIDTSEHAPDPTIDPINPQVPTDPNPNLNPYNPAQTDITIYIKTIEQKDQDLRNKENAIADLMNENRKLQDDIKALTIDPAFIKRYQTHLDTLMIVNRNSPLEVRQRMAAMKKNWQPFLEKMLLLQSKDTRRN